MPARQREDEACEPDRAGEQHQCGGQTVGDEHDAERGRPVAEPVDARAGRIDEHHERDPRRYEREQRSDTDRGLRREAALVDEQRHGTRDERQHDRHHDEVVRHVH